MALFADFLVLKTSFAKMEEQTIDSADSIQVNEIVFDNGENEGLSWNYCNQFTSPPLEILFFTQASLHFTKTNTIFLERLFDTLSGEESTILFFLFFGVVGYILRKPQI